MSVQGRAAGLPAAIAPREGSPASRRARSVLATTSAIHFVHDGFSDVIYLLLPVWATQFGLTYGQVGLLRTVYSGGMAAFQIPAGILAERWGETRLLAAGTAVTALGFLAAGLTGGFAALLACLVLGGLGSGVQHPLSSSLVSKAYETGPRRMALGTYNFAGDLGKVAVPAAVAFIMPWVGWRGAVEGYAAVGLLAAALLLMALMHLDVGHAAPAARCARRRPRPRGLGHRPPARVRGAVRHPRHRQLDAVGLSHALALPAHRQGLDGSRGRPGADARVRRGGGGEVRVRRARRAPRRHPHGGRHGGGDVRRHSPPADVAARGLPRRAAAGRHRAQRHLVGSLRHRRRPRRERPPGAELRDLLHGRRERLRIGALRATGSSATVWGSR